MESEKSKSSSIEMANKDVEKPESPKNLKLVDASKNYVELKWNSVKQAKAYYIFRSEAEKGPFEQIGVSEKSYYKDNDVLTDKPYYYQVAAVNEGGLSDYTKIIQVPVSAFYYRQMENLDRAPIAVKTEEGMYVGWRFLGTDPKNISFNVYRDGKKLNKQPITDSTNYLDKSGTETSKYEIRVVMDGKELSNSETAKIWNEAYFDIPLQKPKDGVTSAGGRYTYHANDASIADLDGDGEYEIILKWDPSNSKDNSNTGTTGNVFIDAYKLDGELLWRIDMGHNVRAGAHYTQFMVYDLDGDGKAEIAMRTADGTTDGTGQVIGDPEADHRDGAGRIYRGPEYLTIFDGETGEILVTEDFDPERGITSDWGDSSGNRSERFLAAIAYLDGESPSLIMARGYYAKTALVAYNWRDGKLTKLWKFDTSKSGLGSYGGQGNHNLSVADVDGDGKDEIVYGAMTVDHDGSPLYNSGFGHGDAMHLGDLDPTRPGLEVFSVFENSSSPYGFAMRDAATGDVIWGRRTGRDTGRGLAANIDPRYPGVQAWAVGGEWNDPNGYLYSAKGEQISTKIPPANFAIWWDGDLLRELLDHHWDGTNGVGTISKWDYENEKLVNLLTAEGTYSNNGTKGNPVLQADLFGDWREEAIWRLEDSSALRVYTTTAVTEHRIHTLVHDPVYRLGIAWQNVAYNQPPHTSFYLGHGMSEPPVPKMIGSTKLVDKGTIYAEIHQENDKGVIFVSQEEAELAAQSAKGNTVTIKANGAGDYHRVLFNLPAELLDQKLKNVVFHTNIGITTLSVKELSKFVDSETKTVQFTLAVSANSITSLVNQLEQDGEFANESVSRTLNRHLIGMDLYEGQEAVDKVIKHTEGFKVLVKQQKEKKLLSERAYHQLVTAADALMLKWE